MLRLIILLYYSYTSGAILPRDGIKCTQAIQFCDGDCIKCPQAVQYCYWDGTKCPQVVQIRSEMVLCVHRQCNIAAKLYQVSTSSTILQESMFYLCTSGAILRQDGTICLQVVQ